MVKFIVRCKEIDDVGCAGLFTRSSFVVYDVGYAGCVVSAIDEGKEVNIADFCEDFDF